MFQGTVSESIVANAHGNRRYRRPAVNPITAASFAIRLRRGGNLERDDDRTFGCGLQLATSSCGGTHFARD